MKNWVPKAPNMEAESRVGKMTLLKYRRLNSSSRIANVQFPFLVPGRVHLAQMEVVKFVNLDFQMWAAKWIGSLRCEDVTWHVWHVALICSWRMFGKWQMVNGWFGLVVCRTSGKDCWPSSIENPRQIERATSCTNWLIMCHLFWRCSSQRTPTWRPVSCSVVSQRSKLARLVLRSWDLEHTPEVPRQRLCNRWRSWESKVKHRRLVGFFHGVPYWQKLVQHEASGWPSFHFVHLVECREPKIQVGYAPPGEHHALLPAIAPLRSYLCHNAGMYFHLSHVLYIYNMHLLCMYDNTYSNICTSLSCVLVLHCHLNINTYLDHWPLG